MPNQSFDNEPSEVITGQKASWELPEKKSKKNGTNRTDALASDNDDAAGVPTNYENTEQSYSDPGFEVQKAPGRLG